MLRILVISFIYFGFLRPIAGQTLHRLDGTTLSTADAERFATQTLDANHVTGAQITVINHGRIVWSYAHGLAGKDPARPITLDTVMWSASISKAIASTYAMQLVSQGKLSLDTPVAKQLPQPLETYPRWKDIAADLVHDPNYARITPRMLLDHTSGLPNIAAFEPNSRMRLRFQPGARYSYSTEGINLLGLLLEARGGKPLDDLLAPAIYQPAGMKRTSFVFRPNFLPDVADRFDKDEKFLSQTRRDAVRAGGSMSSTSDDLARFLVALLNGKLLSSKALDQMLTPQVSIPYIHQFQFGPHTLDEGDETKSVGLSYALGWGILTKTKYGPAFFKEGHGDGAETYIICFRSSKSCMVLQTNSDNGELTFQSLLEHILGDTVTPWEWECYTRACIEASRAAQ